MPNPATLRATVERVAALARVATKAEWREGPYYRHTIVAETAGEVATFRNTPQGEHDRAFTTAARNLDWDALVAALADREGVETVTWCQPRDVNVRCRCGSTVREYSLEERGFHERCAGCRMYIGFVRMAPTRLTRPAPPVPKGG